MNLTMPTQWTLTWPEVAGAAIFLVGLIWLTASAYNRVMARFDQIEERMRAMEKRNTAADNETAVVKTEQHAQREKIAVMAEQMTGFGRTLDRSDRNVETLKEGRK